MGGQGDLPRLRCLLAGCGVAADHAGGGGQADVARCQAGTQLQAHGSAVAQRLPRARRRARSGGLRGGVQQPCDQPARLVRSQVFGQGRLVCRIGVAPIRPGHQQRLRSVVAGQCVGIGVVGGHGIHQRQQTPGMAGREVFGATAAMQIGLQV